MPSGLEHHGQRSGQPLRNTSVRIPGPSWIENFWMSNTRPRHELRAADPDSPSGLTSTPLRSVVQTADPYRTSASRPSGPADASRAYNECPGTIAACVAAPQPGLSHGGCVTANHGHCGGSRLHSRRRPDPGMRRPPPEITRPSSAYRSM